MAINQPITLPGVGNPAKWHQQLSPDGLASATYRTTHTAACDADQLRLAAVNSYGEETAPAGPVTYKYALEVGSTLYPVTFNGGATSITVAAGDVAVSDVVAGATLARGATYRVRQYLSAPVAWPVHGLTADAIKGRDATADATWPGTVSGTVAANGANTGSSFAVSLAAGTYAGLNYHVTSANFFGSDRWVTGLSGTTLTLDAALPGTPAAGDTFQIAPFARYAPFPYLFGRPTSAARRCFGIVGDSIANGANDANYASYVERALYAAGCQWVNVSQGGERADQYAAARAVRSLLLAACDLVVCAHLVNDVNSGATLATLKARLLAEWAAVAAGASGPRPVYQTTCTPITDGSNNPIGGESVRVAVNTWLRDGSAAGAVAQSNGTLAGVIEVADLCETARNSGQWKPGYITDGLHPSTAGHTAVGAALSLSPLLAYRTLAAAGSPIALQAGTVTLSAVGIVLTATPSDYAVTPTATVSAVSVAPGGASATLTVVPSAKGTLTVSTQGATANAVTVSGPLLATTAGDRSLIAAQTAAQLGTDPTFAAAVAAILATYGAAKGSDVAAVKGDTAAILLDLASLPTSGSGAYAVTVTVTDGTSPVQGATVRASINASSYVATTDASGVATFALDGGTYAFAVTAKGYGGATLLNQPISSGQQAVTVTLVPTTPVVPPDPTQSTGVLKVAQAGASVAFQQRTDPAGQPCSPPAVNVTADSSRTATSTFFQRARYSYRVASGVTRLFLVPAASSFDIEAAAEAYADSDQ